jgi:hypothetical protein
VSGLNDFDHIALAQKHMADDGGFDALFQQALARLAKDHPNGFPASAPGRAAWNQLDAAQRELALDSLFFTRFCEDRAEADESLHHAEITAESTYLRDGDLDHIARAAISARGAVTVDSAVLWRALKELRLLAHRVGLLHMLRTTEPMTEEAVQALYEQLRAGLDGNEPEASR